MIGAICFVYVISAPASPAASAGADVKPTDPAVVTTAKKASLENDLGFIATASFTPDVSAQAEV
jgi:hypothetical protein